MDKALAELKQLIVKLAMIHEKIEQGVYNNNHELLQTDYSDYVEVDIEFQTAMDEHIDTLS